MLRPDALQGVRDPLRTISVEVHGDLDRTIQLLVRLRLRRGLAVRARGPCPGGIGLSDGLNEDAWNTAFLHNMLDRELRAASRVELSDDRGFQFTLQ